MVMKIQVNSETARLNGVIVHTPGPEVTLVHPDNKHELLFDDIVFEAQAHHEHKEMLDIFRIAMPDSGNVFEIVNMIEAVFASEDARLFFVERLIKRYPNKLITTQRGPLLDLDARSLTRFAVDGQHSAIPELKLHPSPNLLFTRDLAAVVGDSIVVSQAALTARLRESILMETLIMFHPMFDAMKGKIIRIPDEDSIEGGDILVASQDLVLIGMSERTSFSGVMQAGRRILEQGVQSVLVVDIPKQRSSMHLDTIFTFCSPNECVVFPPAIMQRTHNVVELNLDGEKLITTMKPSLKIALEQILQQDMTFIKCGGEDPIMQHREQWSDGANLFALAPGVVVGYERNVATFQTMAAHGYTVMTQYEFISKYSSEKFLPDQNTKIAISFTGHELCRGRGGARCMTLPVSRIDS
jgi:arginine deiminase